MNSRILEIFDEAMKRAEETIPPTPGWFEQVSDFRYRFRVQAGDLTSFQKYYHEGKYVGCIFEFTAEEKEEIMRISGIDLVNAHGFHIAPNTYIYPHTDNSPKRSLKTTILNLSGQGSVLRLYNDVGDVVFELPEVIDRYTLFPKHIIHSYTVGKEEAKLINVWHE